MNEHMPVSRSLTTQPLRIHTPNSFLPSTEVIRNCYQPLTSAQQKNRLLLLKSAMHTVLPQVNSLRTIADQCSCLIDKAYV
jgi:hypothetical protein